MALYQHIYLESSRLKAAVKHCQRLVMKVESADWLRQQHNNSGVKALPRHRIWTNQESSTSLNERKLYVSLETCTIKGVRSSDHSSCVSGC